MQINIFNVIVVLGFIAGKQLTKSQTHTHTYKTYSRTQKTTTEKRNSKFYIHTDWNRLIVNLLARSHSSTF